MTLTMKAAVLRDVARPKPYVDSTPLVIEDVTLDPPQPLELLVKIGGAGLCHSDLSVINGSLGRGVPLGLGHEGAGEVVEVGSAITDLKPGDPVIFQFSPSCGRCRMCLSGRPQICEEVLATRVDGGLISGGTRLKDADGKPLRHHAGLSCMAEYAVVNRGSVVKIDSDVPMDKAALFGCAVMTGVGAVINTAQVKPGQSVAIFGLGGVGLCGIMGARVAGAETIIAVDFEEHKLAKAMELGATHAFNAKDPDLTEKIMDLTHGGVEFGLDLAGAIPALKSAYAATARGGKVITAGISPIGSEFSFPQPDLVLNEKSVCGSFMGSCAPVRDIPRYLALWKAGLLPVDKLVDRVIPFESLNEGFDRLDDGSALRQVLDPHMAA